MIKITRVVCIAVTYGAVMVSIAVAEDAVQGNQATGRGPVVMKRGKGAQYGPDYRLKMMTRKLKLTDDQQEKIKPILDEENAQLESLRGNDTYNRDERRTKLRQLNKITNEKIRPLLNEEQQKAFDAAKLKIIDNRMKDRRTRPGANPAENDPDNRLRRLSEDLGLTPEQQAKIRPVLVEESGQLEALRGNDTYNREQRRAKLIGLSKATTEKIRAVLTPEQQQKFINIEKKIEGRRSQIKTQNPGSKP
jgi:Spy/CpxP family protein refolding chaperone